MGYTIIHHMLTIPTITNRSLLYGSIITKILRYFYIPLIESAHGDIKKLGREIISAIGFDKKYREWVKTPSSRNKDTLVVLKYDDFLNDAYPID